MQALIDPVATAPVPFAAAWGRLRPGYLDAATMGLPTEATAGALADAVRQWSLGEADASGYGDRVEAARASYARLTGVDVDRVGIGATTSELVGPIAASLEPGDEVVVVEGDFTSIIYPFLQHVDRGVVVRHVPLEALADALDERTALVSFSDVQSADGRVADADALLEAAARVGALTLCDATQSAGIRPFDASRFDLTVCHAYKWLCAPRGAAFLTATPAAAERIRPLNAGWYAGEDVWSSVYGPEMALARSARRFDTSPAWLSWVGAAEALAHVESIDLTAAWGHATGLADALLERLGRAPRGQAIVVLEDDDGAVAAALRSAGVRFSCRAGRLRFGFHLWNTVEDVDLVVRALATASMLP